MALVPVEEKLRQAWPKRQSKKHGLCNEHGFPCHSSLIAQSSNYFPSIYMVLGVSNLEVIGNAWEEPARWLSEWRGLLPSRPQGGRREPALKVVF